MFFFTEPNNLDTQINSSDNYGPVNGHLTKKFNVSADFALTTGTTTSKAFACQKGLVIIQPSTSPNLVNLILRPTTGLDIPYPSVRYYVYRGLKLDSFFTSGGAIIPSSTSSKSKFIEEFWTQWNNQPNIGGVTPSPGLFGYDPSLAGNIDVDGIFNHLHPDVKPIFVKAGTWLGNFGNSAKIAFEVITDTDHIDIDLGYLRKERHTIDVSALANIASPTSQQKFSLKAQREQILAYTDPAAFFGMHHGIGVNVYSGGSMALKKGDDLYTTVLDLFTTKNHVYIDIRNEDGYSYDFHDTYNTTDPHLLKVKIGNALFFSNHPYYTSEWPIFFNNTASSGKPLTKIKLRLRTEGNPKPLLFVENKSLLDPENQEQFLDLEDLGSSSSLWTDKLKLQFPNYNGSGPRVNVAHHIKLQYFKLELPIGSNYLDFIFGGLDLPGSSLLNQVFEYNQASKLTLVNNFSKFTYTAYPSNYSDGDDAIYVTQKSFSYKASSNSYPKSTVANDGPLISKSPIFPKDIRFQKTLIKEGTSSSFVPIYIMEIIGNTKGASTTKKEDIMVLGLTETEQNTLKTTASALSDQYIKRFVFTDLENKKDADGKSYKRYKLKIKGLNNVGVFTTASPATDIWVYAFNDYMFATKAFGDQSNAAIGPLPDPRSMKDAKNTGLWTCKITDAITLLGGSVTDGIATILDKNMKGTSSVWGVPLECKVAFPTDKSGSVTNPSDISTTLATDYPLIVVVHGNGHNYNQYDTVIKELAFNGFIVASINLLGHPSGIRLIPTPHPTLTSGSGGVPVFTHFFADPLGSFFLYNDPSKEIYVYRPAISGGTATYPKLPKVYGTNFLTDNQGSDLYIYFIGSSGFVTPGGMGALGRANLVADYLKLIKAKFTSSVQNNIALIGHSRGGEAVVRAIKELNTLGSYVETNTPSTLSNINAIFSLAPTDHYDVETLTANVPYFVLYGSRDGDLKGYLAKNDSSGNIASVSYRGSGFSLYERAKPTNNKKAFGYVHGATHNGFITKNSDYDGRLKLIIKNNTAKKTAATTPVDKKKYQDIIDEANKIKTDLAATFLDVTTQKELCLSYMISFFRMHLKGEPFWKPYITGKQKFTAIKSKKEYYNQFKIIAPSTDIKVIDDFETNSSKTGSSIGGTVSFTDLSRLEEEDLRPSLATILVADNPPSPHTTKGIKVKWQAKDVLDFSIPTSAKDITGFLFLSFRITAINKTTADIDKLEIGLKDNTNTVYPLLLEDNYVMPSTEQRATITITDDNGLHVIDSDVFTKSAFMTVRLPLAEYSSLGANLSNVTNVIFTFPEKGTGIIHIDSLEFTN